MKLSSDKTLFRFIFRPLYALILICFIVVILTILGGYFVKQKALQTLKNERLLIQENAEIPFDKINISLHPNKYIQFLQNTNNVRGLVKFQDSFFAATDAGLLKFSESGEILQHFTVLDGLPESDLLTLTEFDSKLFIGTRTKGLVSFDGSKFSVYQLKNHPTKSINILMSDEESLYIGTFTGGLLVFDGQHFSEIKADGDSKRLEAIIFLSKDESRLLVGTFNDGLWIMDGGRWTHFTKENGLLSNRITGVARVGNNVFVGTDMGISQAFSDELFIENKNSTRVFHQSLSLPTLSSLKSIDKQILLSKDSGELFSLHGEKIKINSHSLQQISWPRPPDTANSQLTQINDQILYLSNQGIWQINRLKNSYFTAEKFGDLADEVMPSSNIISAITTDSNGKIWLGNFRKGIDVFSSNGKKLNHIETDHIREINFLNSEINTGKVSAATSQGLIKFDKSLRQKVLTKSNKLPGNSIMHVTENARKNQAFLASNNGLHIIDSGKLQILTGVNGLPNNSTYTTLFARNSLYVGTLGGLAQIENDRVIRTFKDSNSNLSTNWVTALCLAGERIFIGTYGGGVFELLPSGEIRSFANEIGKVFVNINAIYTDKERLYVGTLTGGYTLDLTNEKWSNIKEHLPSDTVLSIAGDSQNIYFGTTNGVAKINKNYWLN